MEVGEGGESEVGDFEGFLLVVEEEVLGLDVAVGDAVLVAEVEGGDELLKVAAGGGLGEAAAPRELGLEVAARGEVHDEVDARFRCHDLVDLEDVGVGFEALHGMDFVEDAGFHGGRELGGFGLYDDFDGY